MPHLHQKDAAAPGLAIGELVSRTGVSEGTLRMWERRHGFPRPERLPSGHRRYRDSDVELVQRVLRQREAGLSLPAAIARARGTLAEIDMSIFAGLRRRRPELRPFNLRKPVLLALTRAIEDESCSRAERPLLFGSFQRVRFYRQSLRRWREFARTAELTVAFADFERPRVAAGRPVEVPVDDSHPLGREWALVCEAPGHGVCLAAVELPPARRRPDAAREFDVIWSVEPALVRTAAEVALGLAGRAAPELVERVASPGRPPPPGPPSDEQLRLAATITTRALGRL